MNIDLSKEELEMINSCLSFHRYEFSRLGDFSYQFMDDEKSKEYSEKYNRVSNIMKKISEKLEKDRDWHDVCIDVINKI